MSEKIYVGSGWSNSRGINITVNKEKFNKLPVNNYGDVKLSVVLMREPNQKSKATHFVCLNDYVPGQKTQVKLPTKEQSTPKQQQTDFLDPEDIPFE